MTSGGGDARVAAGAAVEMHVVEAQADLSLSLSLFSDVMRWNVLEVKKKIKRRGVVCLVWRRKTRKKKKEKRKKEMKCG